MEQHKEEAASDGDEREEERLGLVRRDSAKWRVERGKRKGSASPGRNSTM